MGDAPGSGLSGRGRGLTGFSAGTVLPKQRHPSCGLSASAERGHGFEGHLGFKRLSLVSPDVTCPVSSVVSRLTEQATIWLPEMGDHGHDLACAHLAPTWYGPFPSSPPLAREPPMQTIPEIQEGAVQEDVVTLVGGLAVLPPTLK